jgi:hypothetical protein
MESELGSYKTNDCDDEMQLSELPEGANLIVHLCQTSWCDPAVRSHVGSLAGAVWLPVLAFVALQLLAVCHLGGQGPGPEYLGFSNDE